MKRILRIICLVNTSIFLGYFWPFTYKLSRQQWIVFFFFWHPTGNSNILHGKIGSNYSTVKRVMCLELENGIQATRFQRKWGNYVRFLLTGVYLYCTFVFKLTFFSSSILNTSTTSTSSTSTSTSPCLYRS